MTFANHGCDGTYNVGLNTEEITEVTADFDNVPLALDGLGRYGSIFNPVLDRNRRFSLVGGDVTLRDIKAGEELLDNYLAFIGGKTDWEYDLQHLRDQCHGQASGDVTEYESA